MGDCIKNTPILNQGIIEKKTITFHSTTIHPKYRIVKLKNMPQALIKCFPMLQIQEPNSNTQQQHRESNFIMLLHEITYIYFMLLSIKKKIANKINRIFIEK